jgi:hypothetical protein
MKRDCLKAGNGCGCFDQLNRLIRLRGQALEVNTPESLKYAKGYESRIKRMKGTP